jgi:hypothetical protein
MLTAGKAQAAVVPVVEAVVVVQLLVVVPVAALVPAIVAQKQVLRGKHGMKVQHSICTVVTQKPMKIKHWQGQPLRQKINEHVFLSWEVVDAKRFICL